MEKSIIIIGGGLTGLAAGCYGRMNGYKTSIFEMHKIAGGVCTGWKRQGYTIDGAMNFLLGTKPGTSFHKFWEELGAARKWKIHNHDLYVSYEDNERKVFNVYCDADRFEEYLLEIAPEDKDAIREFTRKIRDFSRMDSPMDKPTELYSWIDKIKAVKIEWETGESVYTPELSEIDSILDKIDFTFRDKRLIFPSSALSHMHSENTTTFLQHALTV